MPSRVSVYLSALDYLDRVYELATQHRELTPLERSYFPCFSSYILGIRHAIPVSTIIIAQSPYNRDIFPARASAMSFDPGLTEGTFQEIPATVEVLANDISRTCECSFWDIVEWFRDSWKYSCAGVLVLNTRSVTDDNSHNAEREAARLLKFLKVVVEASAGKGVKSVVVFTLGNPAKDFGDKLRSCVDTTSMPVVVKSAPHPAYISRRYSDLRSPECTLSRPSFCRALFSVIMSSNRTYNAQKKRDSELMVKSINEMSSSCNKISNSYSEAIEMMERDPDTDVISKKEFMQLITATRDAMMDLCAATRDVSTLISFSQGSGGGDNVAHMVASGTTRPPQISSRVTPGEVRSSGTPSRAGSVASGSARVTPAEIRARRRLASAAQTDTMSVTSSTGPVPETPTPKGASIRAQRMASRSKASVPTTPTADSDAKPTSDERRAMSMMAEYVANNREDSDSVTISEGIMAYANDPTRKDDVGLEAVRAIRADRSKDANYDANKYLGFEGHVSIVTSNTYQFCTQYPDWTFKA